MKKVNALCFCLLLAACVGTSSPVLFYTFRTDTTAQVEAVSRRKISVLVSEVNLPATLDRPQIVTGAADAVQLEISETHRWSESLSTLMQRTIAADIQAYLPNANIRPANFSRELYPYKIVIDVNRFEGNLNKNAVLQADWRILGDERQLLKQGNVSLSEPVGATYDDLVVSMGKMLSELSLTLASVLAKV